jgi:hypothetical protein
LSSEGWAAGDLALDEEGERLAQRHLAPCRLVEERIEPIADRGQLEPGQPGDERVVVDRHRQPPPTSRSYSAKGRRRSGSTGEAIPGSEGCGAGRGPPTTPAR